MKVWKISVDDVMLGVVVDKDGSFDSGTALAYWNAHAGPNYQGDIAETCSVLRRVSEDRKRFPHEVALGIANELVDVLRDHCERIEIAGSLRRRKPFVKDIEILFVPKFKVAFSTDNLFNEPVPVNKASKALDVLLSAGLIAKRPNVNGDFAWGEKNKLGIHVPSGIPVDFFATDEDKWWVALVIRTGGKDSNLKLTTGAQKLGKSLNAYGCGVTNSDGTITRATSERHVFELCGVPFAEPKDRP